jgi:hypothetical protein
MRDMEDKDQMKGGNIGFEDVLGFTFLPLVAAFQLISICFRMR